MIGEYQIPVFWMWWGCACVASVILFAWDQLGKWEKRWRIRTGRWPYPEDEE